MTIQNEEAQSLTTEEKPKRKVNFWFTIISLVYLFDIADRNVVAAVLPAIKQEFALTDAAAGLIGSILYLTLGLLVVPAGMLVDRWSRKYMITIMVMIWSAATWATGLARSHLQILTARLFVGVGESGYNPAGYALIGAWYPRRLRGRMVGLFNIAQPFGAVIGMGVGGLIAHEFGWRYVFGIFALPGFLLALLMLFAPDYKAKKVEAGTAKEVKPGPMEALRFIFKNRTLLLIFLTQMPVAFFMLSLSVWGPSFFMRQFNLNMAQAAMVVGAVTLFAAPGAFVGGWLSDRLTLRSPRGRVTATLILLALPILFYSIAFLGSLAGLPIVAAAAALALGQFCYAGHWGSLIAAGLDLVPPHYRGTGQSFIPLFQTITGFWSASLSGFLSDRLGLTMAMEITMLIGCVVGCALLLAAYRTYLADYEKQKALGTFAVEVG